MVIRSVVTELCCPRYGNRGMVSEVFNLGERTVGCRGILPRQNRANECSLDMFFSLQGQEHIALPRMDSVRRCGVQKSALSSLLFRMLRDWSRSRGTRTGCPPYLPMTSEVNGYRIQPTGRGCACPVGITVQDPAPPVMQDVGTFYLGTVFVVLTVPRYSSLVASSIVQHSSPVWRGAI